MALLGNPFAGNTTRQMSAQELVQALRVDIAGELEAIIVYEAHVAATTDERAKKVLSHIADEEKTHIGELEQLSYILCPHEAEREDKGRQEINKQQQSNFQAEMQ